MRCRAEARLPATTRRHYLHAAEFATHRAAFGRFSSAQGHSRSSRHPAEKLLEPRPSVCVAALSGLQRASVFADACDLQVKDATAAQLRNAEKVRGGFLIGFSHGARLCEATIPRRLSCRCSAARRSKARRRRRRECPPFRRSPPQGRDTPPTSPPDRRNPM